MLGPDAPGDQAIAALPSPPLRLFTRNGKPQKQIDHKLFDRACTHAKIEDFRFHDLRHTWASWHVQAGTPLFVLKELGGWETLEMVKRYAHMDGSTLAQFASNVTFTAQRQQKVEVEKDPIVVNA